MKKDAQRLKNFTLIELLVVIAIIAILAGMLLPALNNARGKGMQSQCIGNNKQLLLYLNHYADDYDGYMPPGGSKSGFMDPIAPFWMHAVSLYHKQTPQQNFSKTGNIFSCPADKHIYEPGFYGYRLSYRANNSSFVYVDSEADKLIRRKRNTIQRPSEYVWLLELEHSTFFNPGGSKEYYNGFGSPEYLAFEANTGKAGPHLLQRHNGTITAGRSDGHVDMIKYPHPKCNLNLFMWFRTGVRYN